MITLPQPVAARQISLPGMTPPAVDWRALESGRRREDWTWPVERHGDRGRRLSDFTSTRAAGSDSSCLWVRTFGGLRVSGKHGLNAVALSSRQRQLLRWLVLASWGPPLSVAEVCDVMWPAADGDAAASNFSSTVHRLRRTLGDPEAIMVVGGTVAMNTARCRTDLDVLHHIAQGPHHANGPQEAARMAEALLSNSEGKNPILLAPADCEGMARRIRAVGVAWRLATLYLVDALRGSPHTLLALRLCERVERHGLADERVLAQWPGLAAVGQRKR